MRTWKEMLQQWNEYATNINARAKNITDKQHAKGWALAASVGIGHCGCSLHNASIDDAMTGWCHNNPERLRVAKIASRYINDWRAMRVADKMICKEYQRLISALGAAGE
jgi:hypothetical protein